MRNDEPILNAQPLTVVQVAMRAFPRENWVGMEHAEHAEAFLVRYDGKVWRITVEEA